MLPSASRRRWLVAAFVLTFLLVTASIAALASSQDAAQTRRPRQISSVDGKDLFLEFCAQCHGREGKGDGPRAKEISKPVPDLTRIALRNGGRFKRSKVERFVSGEDRPGSTVRIDSKTGKTIIMTPDGPDPMPVWHYVIRRMWPDQPVQLRIGNIVRYLEKIQVKEDEIPEALRRIGTSGIACVGPTPVTSSS